MSIIADLKNSAIFRKNLLLKKKVLKVYVAMCVHRGVRAKVFNLVRSLDFCPDPKFEVQVLEGDADIVRSRSRCATHFLVDKKDCDVLFFLDDDIVFNPLDVVKAVRLVHEKDLDIVGGMYVTKSETDPSPTVRPLEVGEVKFGKNGYVQEFYMVSTGFMAISRQVLQTMVDSGTIKYCSHDDRIKFYPFFITEQREINGKWEYLSEDWAFCQRARDLGFKVWVDCTTKLGHIGNKTYSWEDLEQKDVKHLDEIIVNFQSPFFKSNPDLCDRQKDETSEKEVHNEEESK